LKDETSIYILDRYV